ncbi:alpha carbonic anhydrase [Catenaria anguillulae PL171]|uniref:Carbonic anhydrase n=1 Tax=Catenaria anguillulae PL171 TaxID=765915 RepID=A0A1Y2I457_9FUNG|nr:alpha carbonic anhydrase [Catenaria anguillulae PL171]
MSRRSSTQALTVAALSALALVSSLASMPTLATAAAVGAKDWGYEALNGPSKWASLSPEFATCGTGKQQSPINLAPTDAKPNVIPSNFQLPSMSSFEIKNTGHTLEFTPKDSQQRGMALNGDQYTLQQFHVHTPSEHRINGEYFAGEVHLVHGTPDGKTAVVGVFIEETRNDNPVWAGVLSRLPAKPETSVALNAMLLDTAEFVNATRGPAFNYMGSLTTPPCTESVSWLIPKTPIKMSAAQLHTFSKMIGFTSRPTMFNENVSSSGAGGKNGGGAKASTGTAGATKRATATGRPATGTARATATSARPTLTAVPTSSSKSSAAAEPTAAPVADKQKEEEDKKKAEEEAKKAEEDKKKAEAEKKRQEEEDLDKPLPDPKKKKAGALEEESANGAVQSVSRASGWMLVSAVAVGLTVLV